MKSTVAAVAATVGTVSAFMAPTPMVGVQRASSGMQMAASEWSKSLPFLVRPTKLDGKTIAGDVGFDPLGLSEIEDLGLDLYWFREAEIKHGRLAMLAVAGTIFVDQFGSLPGFPDGKVQTDTFWRVWEQKPSAIGALVIAVAVFEAISGVAITRGRESGNREPGYFGFDPLNFAKDPSKKQDLALKEVKNGRLAMFAALGFLAQGVTTHETPLQNLGNIFN